MGMTTKNGGPLRVHNATRGTELVDDGRVADDVRTRLVGLIGSPPLEPGQGLLIVPCSSIHMFFMGFAIDAVYLDGDCRVVGLDEGLRPWRIGRLFRGARYVLELPVGTIASTGTHLGDRLALEGYALAGAPRG